MVWIDNISDLSYYNTLPGMPCYCDPLIYPEDLILQAFLGGSYDVIPSNVTVKIEVYSSDGTTLYEDATSYFNWVVIASPSGNKYLNLQLGNNFSPAMYSHGSWILKVSVSGSVSGSLGSIHYNVFEKFTEQYCSPCCPTQPGDITISDTDTQEGEYSELDYGNEYYNIT